MLSCKASGELRGQCSVAQIVLWPVYAEAPVCPVYAAQSDSCKACKSPSKRLELQMDHQQWYCEVLRWCMVVAGISWYCTTLQNELLSIAFQIDRLCSCHQAERGMWLPSPLNKLGFPYFPRQNREDNSFKWFLHISPTWGPTDASFQTAGLLTVKKNCNDHKKNMSYSKSSLRCGVGAKIIS